MKTLYATLIFGIVLSTGVASLADPAFALGGCGRNYHRNPWGACVWGGQNQAWCLRHTGRIAYPTGYGTRHCA